MQSKSGRAEYELSRRERRKTGGCLAGKGGKLEATGGWTAGLLKEAYDLTKKSVSSETRKRYGGIGNIFKDSAKDIVNNWKGLHYGLENRGKCINLLERKLP